MLKFITSSMLNMFFRCPEQFRRRYLEGEIIPPGIAAAIGRSVHKAAEENHKHKLLKEEDLPKDYLQDFARDTYVKIVENEGVYLAPEELDQAKKIIAEGLDSSVKLTGLYRDKIAPEIFPFLIEKEIHIKVNNFPVLFRGTIDLLTKNFLIYDFKTGHKKWTEEQAENSLQPTFYWQMVKAVTGRSPEGFVFKVLIDKKEPEIQTLVTKRTDEDFLVIIRMAEVVLKAVETGLFPPTNPSNWWCSPKFCGYYATCPYIPNYKKTRILAKGF